MTRSKTLAGVATLALMTQGCTTELRTHADLTRTMDRGKALPGLAYNLPMLQYKIDVTRTLTRCPVSNDGLQDAALIDALLSDPEPRVDVAIKIAAKPEYVRGETYVVDYTALNAMTKTTSFTLEPYATTGNLKSISATAEDHTGDVIKDVAKVAFVAGSFALGGPAGAAGAGALIAGADTAAPPDANTWSATVESLRSSRRGFKLTRPKLLKPIVSTLTTDTNTLVGIMNANGNAVTIVDCTADTRAELKKGNDAGTALQGAADRLAKANLGVADAILLVGIAGLGPVDKAAYAKQLSVALAEQSEANAAVTALTTGDDATAKLIDVRHVVFPDTFDTDRPAGDDKLKFKVGAGKKAFATALIVDSHRVVYANDLAKALATWRDKIGAVRWNALVGVHPALKKYVDDDGKSRVFDQAIERVGTSRASDASPAMGRLVRLCNVPEGKLSTEAKAVLISGCLDGLVSVSGWLRHYEPTPAVPSQHFPTLAARAEESDSTRVTDARDGKNKPGLFVRPPERGELVVCTGNECTAASQNRFVADPKDPPTYVPQFGQLRFLPFKNGPFANNTLTLKVEPDGSLTSFEYKTTKAVAAEIAATAADVAAQADAARTKARTEVKDARQAKIDALQYQIDTLAKTKALADAQNPADTKAADAVKAETADLAAQAALAEAKLTRLKAEAALAAYAGGGN